MAFHKPDKMLNIALEAGISKTKLSLSSILMLGFLGGAFIALGFLLDVRVIGNLPAEWGSLSNLLGGAVFFDVSSSNSLSSTFSYDYYKIESNSYTYSSKVVFNNETI